MPFYNIKVQNNMRVYKNAELLYKILDSSQFRIKINGNVLI